MDTSWIVTADEYISDLFHCKDQQLVDTQKSIKDAGMHDISVSATQGKLLQVLAKLVNARQILEIGTFFGYSSIWLARALPDDGQLITLEYDPANAVKARQNIANAGAGHKVEVRTGNAINLLPLLEAEGKGPFDMIFIDADKQSYPDYFQMVLKLSRPGTLIVADNVIRHIYDPETPPDKKEGVIRFNQMVADSDLVTSVIFQTIGTKTPDGMAMAVVN